MSADNKITLSADPAFPAVSFGAKSLAYSGAARGARAEGAIVYCDGGPGPDTRDLTPDQRAVRTAALALLKAIAACECSVDSVILSVIAAAGAEADAVKADRAAVQSVQVKAAAARAVDGVYRTRSKAGKR